ncbi:MAG: ABC transporter substrate-binding protein [Pseudomonadota bacterium]
MTFAKALERVRCESRTRSIFLTAITSFALLLIVWADMARSQEGGEQYDRVLAIGGAVTEIVYALGEEDRLIGRDSTSVYPAAAEALPNVGYIRRLSPEGVLSVQPNLILARENNGPEEAVEVLKSTGIKWVDVPDNFTIQGVDDNIRIIAEALGVREKGDALRAKITAEMEAVKARVERVADKKEALFILSMRDDKVFGSGTGTGAHGIMALAGADNAFGDFEGYKQLSNEAVIEAAPEVIIIMRRPNEDVESDHLLANKTIIEHPALSATPAVLNGNIIRVDGAKALQFGPRVSEAAQELAQALYPDELN